MTEDSDIAKDLIADLRKNIDGIDDKIIDLVKLRAAYSARIARLKRNNNIPLVNGRRDMDIFLRYAEALGQLGKTMASALLLRSKFLEPDSTAIEKPETPDQRG